MKVAELQRFLEGLAEPIGASGGKSCAADLRRAAEGLAPFAELTVAQFAGFLDQADRYAKTGIVPTKGRATKAKTPPDPKRVQQAAQGVLSLCERAMDESVTFGVIESEVKQLNKLSKDEVLEVARQVGVSQSLKTKKAALEEIRRKIEHRKESFQRSAF